MNEEMWLIWKNPTSRIRYKVGKLEKNEEGYIFSYLPDDVKIACEKGFSFFPGFNDLEKIYKSKVLFANIDSRLLNEGRADYLKLLDFYNLQTNSSKMDVLKATKGRLLTDNYEFVPAFNKERIIFDVAGTRYSDILAYKNLINLDDELILVSDEDNKYDDFAIRVIFKKKDDFFQLGYVPRYYSKELTMLLNEADNYKAFVNYLNFEKDIFDDDITIEVRVEK